MAVRFCRVCARLDEAHDHCSDCRRAVPLAFPLDPGQLRCAYCVRKAGQL